MGVLCGSNSWPGRRNNRRESTKRCSTELRVPRLDWAFTNSTCDPCLPACKMCWHPGGTTFTLLKICVLPMLILMPACSQRSFEVGKRICDANWVGDDMDVITKRHQLRCRMHSSLRSDEGPVLPQCEQCWHDGLPVLSPHPARSRDASTGSTVNVKGNDFEF